jgi:hypothetical protein
VTELVSVSVGGYMGPSFAVHVEAGVLTYRTWKHGYRDERELTEPVDGAALERFWHAVEQLGVWGWGERYEDPSVLDGTGWAVELARGGRRLESSGSNAFPPGWERFCAAASRLAGGRELR